MSGVVTLDSQGLNPGTPSRPQEVGSSEVMPWSVGLVDRRDQIFGPYGLFLVELCVGRQSRVVQTSFRSLLSCLLGAHYSSETHLASLTLLDPLKVILVSTRGDIDYPGYSLLPVK